MEAQDIADILAANTKRLMDDRGWSQAELARRMKTHQSNVLRLLEAYYAPSAKQIARVATAFGVELCELLCPTKPKRKKKPTDGRNVEQQN